MSKVIKKNIDIVRVLHRWQCARYGPNAAIAIRNTKKEKRTKFLKYLTSIGRGLEMISVNFEIENVKTWSQSFITANIL